MKQILGLFALLLVIVFGVAFMQNYMKTKSFFLFKKSDATVTINSRTFTLSVARSQAEKEIGLSETKSLSENQGMIFLFDKLDRYSFWMKNMKFPIDIIYINKNSIVEIKNNFRPPANPNETLTIYTPIELSDKVLEINAGLSEKYKFKKGDKVKYENLSN